MTDAAAAPSDASQSSVASDQLRTKKGARLLQATKPASAASPPARVTREGDTCFHQKAVKNEVLGKVLSSESSGLCRTFCRIGEPTADRPRTVFRVIKRDAGDAQAVASWKKSFVRSSTGDDDATSTTVAASAAGGDAPRRRGDGDDVDGPRDARRAFEARRRRDARARASDNAIERTARVISRPPPPVADADSRRRRRPSARPRASRRRRRTHKKHTQKTNARSRRRRRRTPRTRAAPPRSRL